MKAFDIGQLRRSARLKQADTMRSYSQIHKSPLKEQSNQQQSYYLSRWGKSLQQKVQKNSWVNIGQGIYSIAVGQEHVIILNNKNQCFAYGNNAYGQLAQQTQFVSKPIQISAFRDMKIAAVYCGSYHSFVQNNKGQIYGFGLNLKGQLGLGHCTNKKKPTLIYSLLPNGSKNPKSNFFMETNQYKKKIKRNKRSQLSNITNILDALGEQQQQVPQFVLNNQQHIVKICCGPLHTAALSNKNRLFVCGYAQKYALGTGQKSNLSKFTEIKVNHRIDKLQIGLNSLAIVSQSSKLYVVGKIGDKIYQNWTYITDQCQQAKLGEKNIIILTKKGQLYQVGDYYKSNGEKLMTQYPKKIQKLSSINKIFAGIDSFFALSDRNLYGWGNNKYNQITALHDQQIILNPKTIKIPITVNEQVNIISGNGLTFLLSTKALPQEPKTQISSKSDKQKKQNSIFGNLSQICGTESKNMLSTLGVQPRTFSSNMEIDFNQLVFQNQISQGGYGIIYKGLWRQTVVAIKMFKIQSEAGIKDFFSECAAMEALRHPNIVMFLGACTKPPNFSIVLQYCGNGSLWSTIQNLQVNVSWQDRRKFALDTAKGVYYLHTCTPPIIHRDLKSLNLLLDDCFRVKLADFGWTKGLDNYMTGKIGTYQWMAPQVIASQKYSQKADVFSYGIILWQIASRQPPFKNLQGIQVSIEVLNNDLRPTIPKKTPQQFAKLMKKCWDRDPSKRPSFKEIIKQLQTMKL